jgi:superfamily I DNA/RNA helicase
MQPTPEQAAVIAAIRESDHSLLVSAFAGCAKTSTLVAALTGPNGQTLPRFRNSLLLAFAKSNEQDFRQSLNLPETGLTQPEIRTVNALGHSYLMSITGQKPNVSARKIGDLIKATFPDAEPVDTDLIKEEVEQLRMQGWAPEHKSRQRCIRPERDVSQAARQILSESNRLAFKGIVDFTDQIYIPFIFGREAVFRAKPREVFVDEAQDMSELNIAFLRLLPVSRLIVIGDALQSIYGFRGAEENAMESLLAEYDYEALTLSESFRVPHVLTARQQAHAPGFRSFPPLPQGSLKSLIEQPWSPRDFQDRVAVICRNNAPLLPLAIRLHAVGEPAEILGRNIGYTLSALLLKVCGRRPDIQKIRDWAKRESKARPAAAGYIKDQADCLVAFLSQFTGTTAEAKKLLIEIFSVKNTRITLTTGHRAKGKEWDTVIHLDPWRIPSQYAETKRELAQEDNLRYVIETRAKSSLILANYTDLEL